MPIRNGGMLARLSDTLAIAAGASLSAWASGVVDDVGFASALVAFSMLFALLFFPSWGMYRVARTRLFWRCVCIPVLAWLIVLHAEEFGEYPPGVFSEDVCNEALFLQLCPTGDDIWLFWMSALNGATFRRSGARHRLIVWNGSQECALFNQNALFDNHNDRQISAMLKKYGWPFAVADRIGGAQAIEALADQS
ncbi:hypothetical protein C7399_12133 [Paraburkholderia tropica]|uniref:Uncharacterized protein n=2 Tax=Paraburkholderia tropica TaxID=92647 RepID=A0ABX5MK39_9BURK|nr:hypothetical protein C7400_12133 [Paraburkholderia tropica]PZW75314.1 hypothetical protein C7399_12133 [Paraburkholderia tropica]